MCTIIQCPARKKRPKVFSAIAFVSAVIILNYGERELSNLYRSWKMALGKKSKHRKNGLSFANVLELTVLGFAVGAIMSSIYRQTVSLMVDSRYLLCECGLAKNFDHAELLINARSVRYKLLSGKTWSRITERVERMPLNQDIVIMAGTRRLQIIIQDDILKGSL